MKKTLILSLAALLCTANTFAQKRKAEPKKEVTQEQVQQALTDYDFAAAEQLLTDRMADLRKKQQPTDTEEAQLQYTHKAAQKMRAVERITFIDSIIVPRSQVLGRLCLSQECGAIVPASDFLGNSGTNGCTAFRSQMGDKLYYSQADAQGVLRLWESDVLGKDICTPEQLTGLFEDSDANQNYPCMMSDGTTLYFAAEGSESLGGYDIFMSRYDADEHRFLTPENIGMPFNSEANDYLLAIDEYYNIGCFVTDRGMTDNNVCVYYFIPSDTRRVYRREEVGDTLLRSLARLDDLHQTWTNELEVRAAQSRLRECFTHKPEQQRNDFVFLLTDSRTLYSPEEFSSPQAQACARQWQQLCEQQHQVQAQLAQLRQSFRTNREATAPTILQLEQRDQELKQQIDQAAKDIRKAELGL